ncbi:peptidylprolyl isomerase [Bacillus massiliglaciei]|uniref:peptidylprolyl isomerase n=1 Tax=Bacillus massiliglaciei TaxID=1816693 RepID=UPI001F34B244|nr:peptidylprolyl isomerase [Bacillus massiliglaciei]
MNSKTYIWAGSVLLAAAVVLCFVLMGEKDTLASIDGEKIKKQELYDKLAEQYGSDMLEQMIADKIVDLEAKKEKVQVKDSDIQKEIDRLLETYGDEDTLVSQLEASGSSMAELKKEIAVYVKTKKLLEPRIEITDEEISNYFDENKESFANEEQVKASHILTKDKKTAEEVEKKLKAGEDFAKLAKEYSTDTDNKEKGGDLGYFGKGDMTEEFEKAAFNLKVNEVSEPVKTDYGYHVIKVTDIQEAKEPNLEDSKEEIKDALLAEKIQTEYSAWLEEKKKEHDIVNKLES